MNRAWHESHRMPPKATRAERVEWHAEHAKACGCREVPGDLAKEVRALARRRSG